MDSLFFVCEKWFIISLVDEIELKDLKVQSNSGKDNLKDIEDKLGQLVRNRTETIATLAMRGSSWVLQ